MRSYQWFINKANEIHHKKYDYSLVNFVNMTTKVDIICPEHGVFSLTPKSHINKKIGCPKCKKEYKKNYKNFLNKSNKKYNNTYTFPYIENEYENSHSKITIKCELCGHIFKKIACDFITSKNGGCNCRNTPNSYISYDELKEYSNNYTIETFDKLKHKTKDKINVTCNTCNSKIITTPKSIIENKQICKKCNAKKSGRIIPLDVVKTKMNVSFPKISVDYSDYINTNVPLKCTCNICGNVFNRSINAFFNRKSKNSPCPKCSKEETAKEMTKTTEEFVSDVASVYGKDKYEIIGEYEKSNKPIKIKCKDCGRIFEIEANSFLSGHSCPYHNCNSSILEKEVLSFVKKICGEKVIVEHNNRTILNGSELDIYVPSKKLAIEFNGLFWHNENNKPNNYHLKKTEECNKNGIRLIHIFEDEWKYKKNIMKSMIENIIGKTKKRIFARKCDIRLCNSSESKKFLDENHIQGWCPSTIKLGLFYKDELVSMMTFGKSRHFIGNGKFEYELLRFCNKINTTVIGGASKLFKFFIKEYKPNNVISYADRRWSIGNLYYNLGFTFSHNSKPNYFYIIKDKRKNRFNFRKSILIKKYNCDENVSEREFCKQKKWYRIYDCGCMCFMWNNNQ